MSILDFIISNQNSAIFQVTNKIDLGELGETMSFEKFYNNPKVFNNRLINHSFIFIINKDKKRKSYRQVNHKKEKKIIKKKSFIERKSTNSDTAIKSVDLEKQPFNINSFDDLPKEGIFYDENILVCDKYYTLDQPYETEDIIFSIINKTKIKRKKSVRIRASYKEKNTKTLKLDNEHFKTLLKKSCLDYNTNIFQFIENFDKHIVITYFNENYTKFSNINDIIDELNTNYIKIKSRKITKKYSNDNTFRKESLNCKLMNHAIMFCSLVLSYLYRDPKLKITIKDSNKKSIEYIINILNNSIEDMITKFTNRYINMSNYTSDLHLSFIKLKFNDCLNLYYKSNVFKLMIYENSNFEGKEEKAYSLDYSCCLIKQSESIYKNYLAIYK